MSEQLALALEARDRGIRQVQDASDKWERDLIDQAILTLAALRPTSANDFRDELPEIRNRALIGAQFRSLLLRKKIRKVGEVTSTDVGTHAKKIGSYVTAEFGS